jgi:hypothetical protein
MVKFDDHEFKELIKKTGKTEKEINVELGASNAFLSYARTKQSYHINSAFIKSFCETYFPNEPELYKRIVVVSDWDKYLSEISLKRVKADFEKIQEDTKKMNLAIPSLCKVFGYNEHYFKNSRSNGIIGLEFVQKVAELTGAEVDDYIITPEEPKQKEEPVTNNDTIEDINACMVSILKVLQRMDANMQKIAEELGVK